MSDDLPDQNNNPNTVDPVQSWIAQHEARDSSGKFASSEHNKTDSQTTPNSPNLPSPVSFTQDNKYSEKNDPPLVDVKVTNPVTYLKNWLKRLLKNEGIDFRFRIRPITAILIATAVALVFTGTGFTVAKWYFLPILIPNSMVTKTSYVGTLQKSNNQYYLITPGYQVYTLKITNNLDLTSLIDHQVIATGKLDVSTNTLTASDLADLGKNQPSKSETQSQTIYVPVSASTSEPISSFTPYPSAITTPNPLIPQNSPFATNSAQPYP